MAAEVMVVADALVDGDRRLPPISLQPPPQPVPGATRPRVDIIHDQTLLNQYRGRRVPASTSSTTKP